MVGEPLAIAHMDATMFHDDCAYLTEWPGNPVTELEGELISRALGTKRAILLSNHGLATVGTSIEEATWMAVCFERAAKMQIRARRIGPLSFNRSRLRQGCPRLHDRSVDGNDAIPPFRASRAARRSRLPCVAGELGVSAPFERRH